MASSYLALQDSGLDLDKEDRHRIGVAMGTAYAGLQFGAQEYDIYKEKGIQAISPYMGIAIFTGAAGGLGFGVAARLAEEQAVLLTDINAKLLGEAAAKLAAKGATVAHVACWRAA